MAADAVDSSTHRYSPPISRQLPTKYVTPGRLDIELKNLLGHDTDLKVQVSITDGSNQNNASSLTDHEI